MYILMIGFNTNLKIEKIRTFIGQTHTKILKMKLNGMKTFIKPIQNLKPGETLKKSFFSKDLLKTYLYKMIMKI